MKFFKKIYFPLCLSMIFLISACGADQDIDQNIIKENKQDSEASQTQATTPSASKTSKKEPIKSWKEAETASEDLWEKSKKTGQDIWSLSKESSKEVWKKSKDSSKNIWAESKDTTEKLWEKSKQKTKKAWQAIETSSEKTWQESSEKIEEIFNELEGNSTEKNDFNKKNEAFEYDEI